jgi:hypothetical protein
LGLSDRTARGKFGSLPVDWRRTGAALHEDDIGNQTDSPRREMQIAMSNVLALMWWRGYRFYDDFGSRDLTWLLIGAVLAFVGMWVYSRRSRRWF